MGKVIKIILSVASALVLMAIFLPVIVIVLLNVESVQNSVSNYIEGYLSRRAQTEISIGRVDMKLFRELSLTDIYVEDHSGDTLLYADNLSVSLIPLNYWSDGVMLSKVALENGSFYIVQDSTLRTNLQRVLSNFKSKKEKDPNARVYIYASEVLLTDIDFRYVRYQRAQYDHGINFRDLEVNDIDARFEDLVVDNDSIISTIEYLGFREKSGFEVEQFATPKAIVSPSGIYCDNLTIKTPDSDLFFPYLQLLSGDWSAYKGFVKRMNIRAEVKKSRLTTNTLSYFARSLRDWNLVGENINFVYEGPISNMRANISSLVIGDTKLNTSLAIQGLPNAKDAIFDFNVKQLTTDAQDVYDIVKGITKRELSASLMDKLENLGDVEFEGNFKGRFTNFVTGGEFRSQRGSVMVDMNLRPLKGGETGFGGHLSSYGFDLGGLLDAAKLGQIAFRGALDGHYNRHNGMMMNTNLKLDRFDYNDYRYSNVGMNGRFENRNFIGRITGRGKDLVFDFDGMLDFNDTIPHYNFVMDLKRADLTKLNFNRRDSISQLSCHIDAEASGTTLDNVDGEVKITDLLYVNHIDSVRTGEIRLRADNDVKNKRLTMNSSFMNAEFMSRSSYADMFGYFDKLIRNYIPSLHSPFVGNKSNANEKVAAIHSPAVDGYYVMKVDVHEANNVAGIFLPGLQVARGTSAVFMFNPQRDVFSLNMKSDYIERANSFISNLSINGHNQGDSIALFLRADDIYVAGMYMPEFSVIGGARDNKINLSTRFNNPKNGAKGLISTVTKFGADSSGKSQVSLRFNPSTITVNGQQWRIGARKILADTSSIVIDRFLVRGAGQSLSIDGVVSAQQSDTLKLTMKNFDLAPFSQLGASRGYSVRGRMNGYADVSAVRGAAMLDAEIDFDSVSINDNAIPDTRFTSRWDFKQQRARLYVDRLSDKQRLIVGYYKPTDGRYYAKADLKGVNFNLLDPLLKGVVERTRGSVDLSAEIYGQGPKFTINGKGMADSLVTRVPYTNVEYTMRNVGLNIANNVLKVNSVKMYDTGGGNGLFNLSLDMNSFRNLRYNVDIKAVNLMALNTTPQINEQFYGRIFGNGTVSIRGDRRGVTMGVSMATRGASEFYMPLRRNASASEADFIVFESPKKIDENNYQVRKQLILNGGKRRTYSQRGGFDMNMQLAVNPNLEFQLVIDPTVGDIIKGRGNGTINMRINPRNDEFTMYGDYQITEGSYLFTMRNIINKKFVIEPGGTIRWTGEPLNANLDITAVYKLKTSLAPLLNSNQYTRRVPVDCEIHLGERLSQPLITFDVSIPNADPETQSLVSNALNTQEAKATQFLWLLAVNSFYSDNSNSEHNVSIGATGSAVTGIEFLSNQLSNWLSSDRFSLVPRYRPRSETTNDEFGFEFSAELIKNRLVIEGEGSYGAGNNITSVNNTNTNFSNDLTAYWLFDNEGNVKAKAFTRTIDRFDENQGLQESGIGIFYRQNFDNFKELLENFKRRFKSRNKKAEASVKDNEEGDEPSK